VCGRSARSAPPGVAAWPSDGLDGLERNAEAVQQRAARDLVLHGGFAPHPDAGYAATREAAMAAFAKSWRREHQ
jgi:hypothetical protein